MEKNKGRKKMKTKNRGRTRKMSEEDSGKDEAYVKGCTSAAVKRTSTGLSRPLTRYTKKLAAQGAADSIPPPKAETPARNADRNPSELSTIMLVQQIVCGINAPYAARRPRNIPKEELTKQSSTQAEIPIAIRSTPSSNDSIAEIVLGPRVCNHQIHEETYSTASNASTEELMSDPPLPDHAYQESYSSLAHMKLPSQISSPNYMPTPLISLKEKKLSISVDNTFDANEIVSGLPQVQNPTRGVVVEVTSSQGPVPPKDLPQSNDLNGQNIGPDIPCHKTPSISRIMAENHMLVAHENPPSNIKPEVQANSTHSMHGTRSVSLNLTQMVDLLHDESTDCDEVESGPNNNPWANINGYKVQKELGPVLKAIIDKYGDIAKRSSFSMETRLCHLEMACRIYQKLEASKFKHLTKEELERMLEQVDDLQILQLEVTWLRDRLMEISEAKQLCDGIFSLKQERIRNLQMIEEKTRTTKEVKERLKMCGEAIERRRKELESLVETFKKLKEAYNEVEDELAEAKSEKDEINEKFLVTKAKFRKFYDKSLVDGLF